MKRPPHCYRVHDPREDTESELKLGWACYWHRVTESTIRERILKVDEATVQAAGASGYRVHDPREDTERQLRSY